MLIAAAAMTFSGCNKDEATPSSDNLVKIHVKAVSSDSRSTFIEPDGNTYPTRWSGNEKVKFSLNYAYNGAKAFDAVTEDGGVTADFDIQLTDDESGEYTLVAVSPTSASISFSNEHMSATIDVPAIQTPLASSCDEAAQILVAKSATTATLPTEVSMSFKHMTAYGCFSLANFSAPGTVASIILTSEANLAGRYYYYPATRTQSDNVPVKSISLETSARENIWFACVPADWSNTDLTVKVTMDNGAVYTATKNFPADRVMNAGQIAKFVVDMSGAEYSAPVPYELVTNPYNLAIGDTFIIAAKNSNVALGANQATKFRNEAAILKEGTSILSPSSEVEIFEVENAATDNFLYKATVTEGYLHNDENTNQVKTTPTATYWTLDIVDGAAILKLKENTTPKNWLRHNSSDTRFACYGSGQNDIAIYAKSGGATPTAVFLANAENTDLTSTATSALFTVRGNVAWTATIEGNATFDNGTKTLNGNDNQEVQINFEANSDKVNSKSYSVTVATTADVATKSYTLTFTQDKAPAVALATYTWTLANGEFGETGDPLTQVTKGTPAIEWAVSYDWVDGADQYIGWNSDRGIQFGVGNATRKCNAIVLNGSFGANIINNIVVNTAVASNGNAQLTVSVGGTTLQCNEQDSAQVNNTASANYTFTSTTGLTGDIVITITNSVAKAFYLKEIHINQ